MARRRTYKDHGGVRRTGGGRFFAVFEDTGPAHPDGAEARRVLDGLGVSEFR